MTDGEKAWRRRDEEFDQRTATRPELLTRWNASWDVLFNALGMLSDEDFSREITIRRQRLTVDAALSRSLAHASYYIGQIVYLAKSFRGQAWTSFSIPVGRSEAFNRNPAIDTRERAKTQ
jgi:hypothetical protein